jgi:exonuclease SbcC
MRLHRLSFGAVGPFAAAYDLDLDRVAAGGLFLLEGPTGAGKSTVLDAITFALYGSVAGRSSSKERLHTDFATAVEPFVELELSVGGVRHRVRRSPSYSRPKRDGSGTTPVQASVRLWRTTPGGEQLVSSRVREADDEIRDLLGGLSRDQFCQVVVLPQGEFASFLRADADERRDVLQRLFATDHYQAVERTLVEMRHDAARQVERADTVVRDALAALVEASADHDLDVGALLLQADDARRTRLDLAEDVLRELADRAEVQERAASARRTSALAAHDVLAERARLAEVRRNAEALRDLLADRDEQVALAAATLDAATRAAGVGALVGAVERAAQTVRQRRAELVEVAPHLDPDDLPADLDAAVASARVAIAALEPLADVEAGLTLRRAELAAVRERVGELDRRGEQLSDVVAAQPARLEAARADFTSESALAATHPDVVVALAAGRARLAGFRALPQAHAAVAAAHAELRSAIDHAQAARDRQQELVAARLRGMAAELASSLVPDGPCPVCGSAEHPTPAMAQGDRVDDDDLVNAEAAWQGAHAARAAATGVLAEARAALDSLSAAAGEQDPAPYVDSLVHRERAARTALGRLDGLTASIAALEADLVMRREEAVALGLERAALEERAGALVAACAADDAVLAEARAGAPSIAVALAELRRVLDSALRAAAAAQALQEATRALATSARLADDAARAAGFLDSLDAASAVRDDDSLARARAAVRAHEQAWAGVRSALSDPDIASADTDLPDLEPTRAAVAEADTERDAAHVVAVAARQRVSRVRSCRAVLDHAVAATSQVRAATRPVVRVADAATGQSSVNPRRMTLSTYVLRERFDSVVVAASRRLELMSSGRFVLERDETPSGNRKAGLGLTVLDQWTGARRDTRTLSGGESFYASLALALGLADVVRDEVGGVELETLFIDEGFGSLDPDALESVLDVIDTLRDGGRVVGIVSHVAELKERVPDRIEVRRRADGSSAVSIRA